MKDCLRLLCGVCRSSILGTWPKFLIDERLYLIIFSKNIIKHIYLCIYRFKEYDFKQIKTKKMKRE